MSWTIKKKLSHKLEQYGATSYIIAVSQAFLVTVLWSSSYVIIKIGLAEVPPLTFSGLRYATASIILLGVIGAKPELRSSLSVEGRTWWGCIFLYGVVFVFITQGAQYIGLLLLKAITVSSLLNLTPIVVLVLGAVILHEKPTATQVAWIIVATIGVILYFYPFEFERLQLLGLIVLLCGVLANAISSILGRSINREHRTSPLIVTGLSMTTGAFLLLLTATLTEGVVMLSATVWMYILWLSVVNTAFAFTLWNKAMQTLRAVDVSLINSTMLPQIVILSMIFLGEMPNPLDWIGLTMVVLSVLAVQISQARKVEED